MQEWRFFVKSEQSYNFFFSSSESRVVNSISEKKKKQKNVFMTHQNNLIHSVENNLTIILVQECRFFDKSEQSYKFFSFSTTWSVLKSIGEVSARTLNKKHVKIF